VFGAEFGTGVVSVRHDIYEPITKQKLATEYEKEALLAALVRLGIRFVTE
jgi:anaerobic glycerol-3-phosphate dehydrogenase